MPSKTFKCKNIKSKNNKPKSNNKKTFKHSRKTRSFVRKMKGGSAKKIKKN